MGKILVTGGTGYLGTHMLVELVKQGYEPLCVDNLHNSNPSVLLAVKEICGKEIPFIKADAGDVAAMRALFAEYQIDAAIHFAGHKAVGESVAHPLMYYRNNYDSALRGWSSVRGRKWGTPYTVADELKTRALPCLRHISRMVSAES